MAKRLNIPKTDGEAERFLWHAHDHIIDLAYDQTDQTGPKHVIPTSDRDQARQIIYEAITQLQRSEDQRLDLLL
jgi:hypothetical protein